MPCDQVNVSWKHRIGQVNMALLLYIIPLMLAFCSTIPETISGQEIPAHFFPYGSGTDDATASGVERIDVFFHKPSVFIFQGEKFRKIRVSRPMFIPTTLFVNRYHNK